MFPDEATVSMTPDEHLLRQYLCETNPTAFRQLVERYAGLVYGVGLRITGDRQAAEDLSQDCFLELARNGESIRGNLAAWLHAVATNRALNWLRAESRRDAHERASIEGHRSGTQAESGDHETWAELEYRIDQALEELDEAYRLPLIMHYLEGVSQQEISDRLGVHQSTISRRIETGLEQLRNRLKRWGIMVTVPVVSTFLAQGTAYAASTGLTASLSKIGIAGIGGAAAIGGGMKTPLFLMASLAATITIYFVLGIYIAMLCLFIQFLWTSWKSDWLFQMKNAQGMGHRMSASPFYIFKRWTWSVPPAGWKRHVAGYLMAAVTFIGVGAVYVTNPKLEPAMMFIPVGGFVVSLRGLWRILARVWRCHQNLAQPDTEELLALNEWADFYQRKITSRTYISEHLMCAWFLIVGVMLPPFPIEKQYQEYFVWGALFYIAYFLLMAGYSFYLRTVIKAREFPPAVTPQFQRLPVDKRLNLMALLYGLSIVVGLTILPLNAARAGETIPTEFPMMANFVSFCLLRRIYYTKEDYAEAVNERLLWVGWFLFAWTTILPVVLMVIRATF